MNQDENKGKQQNYQSKDADAKMATSKVDHTEKNNTDKINSEKTGRPVEVDARDPNKKSTDTKDAFETDSSKSETNVTQKPPVVVPPKSQEAHI